MIEDGGPRPPDRSRTLGCAALILIAGLALAPRLALVGEVAGGLPQWRVRAERYWDALLEGRLADTYQGVHPGATVMVLSGAAIRLSGAESPAERLEAATWPLAVLCALGVALAVLLLARLLRREGAQAPEATAAVAGVLLALDPMLVSMSGVVCLDGLLVVGCLVATLLAMLHLRTGSRSSLLLAAGAIGFCVATKISGLVLLGAIALLPPGAASSGGDGVARAKSFLFARRRRWLLATGLAAAVLVPALLLPALWADPSWTVRQILLGGDEADSLSVAVSGRHPDVFFLGEATRSPGVLFYPLDLLFRLTPLALIGLLSLPIAGRRSRSAVTRGLLLTAVVVLAALTVADKKNFRYTSMAVPFVDVLAAIGLVGAARALSARWRPAVVAAGLAALLALQGAWVLAGAPHYTLRLNPLVGGAVVGERAVPIGWGEGLEEVVRFLDAEAVRRGRPVTWSGGYRQPFGVLGEEFAPAERVRWLGRNPKDETADYHVLYVSYVQRGESRRRDADRWWETNGRVVRRVERAGITLATILGP